MTSKPLHLHPLAALTLSLKNLKHLALPLVAVIVTDGFRGESGLPFFMIMAGGGMFFSLIIGWELLSWRRFTYQVEDNELRLQQGVFIRHRKFIPLERIQTVDLTQGVLQRLFRVVTVRVETAGGLKSEAELAAVSIKDAELLRQKLLVNREPGTGEQDPASETAKVLSNRDLLVFGLTSGGSLGIAISALSGGWAIFDDLNLDSNMHKFFEWIWVSGYALAFALCVIAVIWLLAFGGICALYGGFSLTRSEDRLQIAQGFLYRREVSIPIKRIQAVCLIEGILRQPFGYVTLQVESAGFATESSQKLLLWPLLPRNQVAGFLEEYLPEFARDFELKSLSPTAGRRYILQFLLPLTLVALPLSLWFNWGKYALPFLPLSLLWGLWRYKDAAWSLNGDMLAVRFRILNRTTALIPRHRVQSFTLSRSPLQRRAGLANFGIPVAGAAFGLIHISESDGDRLLDWVNRSQSRVNGHNGRRNGRPRQSQENSPHR